MTDIPSKCTRCGKQRIVATTHQETIGTSVVTYTQTICPDPDCQKVVLALLEKERLKRQQSQSLYSPKGFMVQKHQNHPNS